ncbi:MAG: DUF4864 domain-containing protein [Rhodospirillales bacterium]|nr:DUF4864 domain-containing protein [Rhodospirillales bacterium]MCB9997316.1 DUF4864 domain-containing protein [Rhodospirillales bacterium]
MKFHASIYLTFGVAAFCILMTLVAINANADDIVSAEGGIEQVSIPAVDADPAHQLITRQLDAIRERDADLAWSMTSEDLHEKYETPKEFLSHLRFELRPIYNHDSYKFLSQYGGPDSLTQKVEMEDSYTGDTVTVIYRLEKQADGLWQIDSFAILPDDAQPI